MSLEFQLNTDLEKLKEDESKRRLRRGDYLDWPLARIN